MRKPANILQHELIGLECEIEKSPNKAQERLKGTIIDETMNTITLENHKRKTIPKKGTIFKVKLNHKTVKLEGNYLVSRPEDRVKKKAKKW